MTHAFFHEGIAHGIRVKGYIGIGFIIYAVASSFLGC